MLLQDLTDKFKDVSFGVPVEKTNNFHVKDKVHTANRGEKHFCPGESQYSESYLHL